MSPKQKKIAAKAPPTDKIDAKDFAVLKAEKAKGRGMGLQDESIKPGKVMKARVGKEIKADPTKPISSVAPKASDVLKDKKFPVGKLKALGRVMGSRAALLGAIGAGAAAGLNMAGKKLKKVLDERKARKRDEAKDTFIDGSKVAASKLSPRMAGGMMKRYSKGGGADTGKQGEMKSKIAVGTMRVNKILGRLKGRDRLTQRDIEAGKELLNQKKFTKRMGGGMMQKPMGYSKGVSVKARGCKLGRTRPTKMY
jgi:hypothetical protein